MNFSELLNDYKPYKDTESALISGISPICISGVSESAQSQLIYQLTEKEQTSAVIICYSDLEAMAMYRDISYFTKNAVLFPSKEYVFYDIDAKDRENEQIRLNAIYRAGVEKTIIVTSIDACSKYTIAHSDYEKSKLTFEIGNVFNLEEIAEKLVAMGYENYPEIEGRGQFSLRGGILDIFSPNMENPVRIEFFGDEVDSLREFDADTQRSIENIKTATIVACKECILDSEKREKLIEHIKKLKAAQNRKKEKNLEAIDVLEHDLEKVLEKTSFPAIDKYKGAIYDEFPTILDYFEVMTIFIID